MRAGSSRRVSMASALPKPSRSAARERETEASGFLSPDAHQPLLRHACHQRAVTRVDQSAGKAARAGHGRCLLRVEQPVVGAERAMQPERMIEARAHELLLEQAA